MLCYGYESVAAFKFTKGFAAIWVFRRWKSRRGEIEFVDNILFFQIEFFDNVWIVQIELVKLNWGEFKKKN